MKTARQRWYQLHHAQREARRHDQDMLLKLTRMKKVGIGGKAVDDRLGEAIERLLNPPMIYDPALPHGGLDMGPKPRRLP